MPLNGRPSRSKRRTRTRTRTRNKHPNNLNIHIGQRIVMLLGIVFALIGVVPVFVVAADGNNTVGTMVAINASTNGTMSPPAQIVPHTNATNTTIDNDSAVKLVPNVGGGATVDRGQRSYDGDKLSTTTSTTAAAAQPSAAAVKTDSAAVVSSNTSSAAEAATTNTPSPTPAAAAPTPAPSLIQARRLTAAADRDRKLMSVLAARRQEHGGRHNQLRAECDRNCTSNFTTRATAGCISQCVQLYREESTATVVDNSNGNRAEKYTTTTTATASGSGALVAAATVERVPALTQRQRAAHRHFDGTRGRHVRPSSSTLASVVPAAAAAVDELLDTEESQASGLYVTQPRERYAAGSPDGSSSINSSHTKDVANRNSSSSSSSGSSTISSLARISVKSNVIENEVRQTSTEKVGRPAKRYDGQMGAPVSVEDSDLQPFQLFGQKLRKAQSARRASIEQQQQPLLQSAESVNLSPTSTPAPLQQQQSPATTAIPRRTPLGAVLINSRTSSKLDQEEEIAADSNAVAKQVSKLRRLNTALQFRNIVTLNRKFGGNLEAIRNATGTGVSYIGAAPAAVAMAAALAPTDVRKRNATSDDMRNNDLKGQVLAPGLDVVDVGNAAVSAALEETVSPSTLLIHVPDPDPVTVQENEILSTSISSVSRDAGPEVSTTSTMITTTTTTETPTSVPTTKTTPATVVLAEQTATTEMPTTTSTTTARPTVRMIPVHPISNPNPVIFLTPETPTTPETTSPGTTSTTTTTTTTQPPSPVSSTPRTFTRTTVSSSVRSTINSRFRPSKYTTSTTSSSTTTSTTSTPTTLILSKTQASMNNNVPVSTQQPTNQTIEDITSFFSNGRIPTYAEVQELLARMNVSRSSTTASTTVKPNRAEPASTTTPSTTANEVTIEMHRMNMATYVLAGLGVFPIVAILLYLARSWVFRRPAKTDAELERYMSENQKKISPVVKLDVAAMQQQLQQPSKLQQQQQSIGGQQQPQHQPIYSEGSIMTEESFNRNLLKFKSLLGEGNFGQVWKAEADDLLGHMGTTRIVAVKTERCGMVNGGLQEEAVIMRKLGSHANVVTLLGACTVKEPHLLIMEFAMRGRLLSLLRAARSATTHENARAASAMNPDVVRLAPLSPRRLAGFAHDISRGMEYISDRKIVHRDLAARNVLLDHNGVCKICDFGMSIDLERSLHLQPRRAELLRQQNSPETSRFRFDFHRRSLNHHHQQQHHHETRTPTMSTAAASSTTAAGDCKRPALPIRWMAPEALQYHIFSPETDVWAFGIVLWEIATLGCTPYPSLTGRQVVRNIPTGTRPDIPHDCRPELYDLMTRTWRKDPRLRPTFTEARLELSRLLCQWEVDDSTSDYLDISGFSEDLEQGMVYFNRRIPEFECEI